MNYERYYDKRGYGNYVVHFANSNGLNEDTVMNLFSRFGKVVNVNNRGKSYGLCFVSYGSLEDVKRCIAGFENDKVIKILPHINKFNINGGKKHKNKNKSMFTKEFVDQSMHMTSSGKYKSEDQQSDKESNSSITYKLKNSNSSKISSENLTSEDKIFDETKIPPLMPIDRKYTRIHRTSMPSTKFVPAEEVIVANIHPCLSIHYILHLFEKHNPIAISKMMTTVKTGISYCHVYYKTYEEANATTEEFDKCSLFGKNLIVLTSCQLMKEASQL